MPAKACSVSFTDVQGPAHSRGHRQEPLRGGGDSVDGVPEELAGRNPGVATRLEVEEVCEPAVRHTVTVGQLERALGREHRVPHADALPAKGVAKTWSSLWQPKLNVAWLPHESVFLRVIEPA